MTDRKLHGLGDEITNEEKVNIVDNCVNVAKTMKGMFGLIYHYELYNDQRYLEAEKKIARNTLDILNAIADDSRDEDVIEAKAYFEMLLRQSV